MWFWLSLIAILFWSGSDLFSKLGSPRDDKYSHWKIVMAVGTIMGIHAVVEIVRGAEFHIRDMITYLPASSMYILSMIIGYVGLRYLVLSLSTPICNCSGAVAAALCFLLLNQTMTTKQLIAVILITLAIFSISVLEKHYENQERSERGEIPDAKYTHSFLALFLPIAYCVIDALGTFFDGLLLQETDEAGTVISGYLSEESANIAYELTFLLMAVFAFVFVVIIKKEKLSFSSEKSRIAGGLCETAGQLAYIYAIGDNIIVAAPLISSYCLFSMLWARIFLKEKLTKAQYVLIAIAAVGIILMGFEG